MTAATAADIRTWLREQGHDISDKGQISATLRAEYEAAALSGTVTPGAVTLSNVRSSSTEY